jgi:hypothetical protein
VAEREVVANRIFGIEARERVRDLERGTKRCVRASREAEVPGDAMDVRVDRDDEQTRRDLAPETEIDAVVAADHPAQIEKEPLRRGALPHVRDEVAEAPRGCWSTEIVAEHRQRMDETVRRVIVDVPREGATERAVLLAEQGRAREHPRDVRPSVDAVHEARELSRQLALARVAQPLARVLAEHVEHAPDAPPDRHDVPERERRREQPDDLAILVAGERMDEPERIVREPRFPIRGANEHVEVRTQRVVGRERERTSWGALRGHGVAGRRLPRTRVIATSSMLRSIVLVLAISAASCGGASSALTGSTHGPRADRPIEMSLRTVDGHVVDLADQRGGLVLLFVLATYDGLSQAAVRPVTRFTREAADTVVLGVVVEPNAEQFADVYQSTFRPPYTVVYDETGTIALGTSDLGELPGVPAFYMIDAHGMLVDRRSGYVSEHELFALRDRALSRGGIVAAPPALPAPAAVEPTAEAEPSVEEELAAPDATTDEEPAPEDVIGPED